MSSAATITSRSITRQLVTLLGRVAAVARVARVACLAGVACASLAPAAQAGGFGVQEKNFEAGTCTVKTCTYASVEKDPGEAFTQAAGHPPYGITGFELNSESGLLGKTPIGAIKRVRVDVPPGLAANPQALAKCKKEDFEKDACPANTEVGVNELTIVVAGADMPVSGSVYNLEQPPGLPLEFGIHVDVAGLVNEHIFLEGHVSWNTDYHEYFEINNIS
ncbi:MAG TPA: hypothetical protein VMS02_05500, partial [Solirubrobacteraceae bacterium]|nr:hypothetical protein [Solirubrobacteraceae bacterium]